ERAVGAEHTRRKTLEQHGILGRNAQVPKTALRVRHRQRERACGGAGIVVLPRERFHRLTIRSHAGRKTESRRGPRREPDPLAKADDRIEHDTRGARKGASIERQRMRRASAAAKKVSAIGFPFERSLRTTFEGQDVECPPGGGTG